jgi:hypothetical protein
MAGTIVADTIQADSTSTLLIQTGSGTPVTAVSIDTSQNVRFVGAIRSNTVSTPPTIQDSAGTQIGTFCRAWVNFNGTTNVGGFCTIRASFNVTTVADNGTGDYTINFTTAMPDANYAVVGTAQGSTIGNTPFVFEISGSTNPATSSCRIQVQFATAGGGDRSNVCASFFR